jgi:thioredoxin reductase
VEREKAQAGQQKLQTVLSVGATLLGAFMGRKVASVGNLTRATSAARSASKIGKEMDDVARAGESVAVLQERLTALEQEFERETAGLHGQFEPSAVPIERTRIHPRKSDILTGQVGLCWMPWKKGADGLLSPA